MMAENPPFIRCPHSVNTDLATRVLFLIHPHPEPPPPFPPTVCSVWGRGEESKRRCLILGGGKKKKKHLDLSFISGADPLSGENPPRSWLWNREWLYACLLQCSSYNVLFHFSTWLRECLERHVLCYLH